MAYKRVEDAVRCFSRTGRRLKVVGEGPEFMSLKRQAGPNVEFCGRVIASELRELYGRCRALLMPGEEDFGMVAVEAMASGKAVIALGRGGVSGERSAWRRIGRRFLRAAMRGGAGGGGAPFRAD